MNLPPDDCTQKEYDAWIEELVEIERNPPGDDATKAEKIDWLVARRTLKLHRESLN